MELSSRRLRLGRGGGGGVVERLDDDVGGFVGQRGGTRIHNEQVVAIAHSETFHFHRSAEEERTASRSSMHRSTSSNATQRTLRMILKREHER